MRLDFSEVGRARVALFTIAGTLICMAVALAFVGYSSQFLTGTPRLLSWVTAVAFPILISCPILYWFSKKLRELAITKRELLVLASRDGLTGCLNRTAFVTLVDAYLTQINAKAPICGALLMVDADKFKAINDRYGHAVGDMALKLLADAIRSDLRPTDLVGRVGGEEFAVFLPQADERQARTVAERIRANVVAVDFRPRGATEKLSVSIGGADFRTPLPFAQLFNLADARLYRAKAIGRNRVEWDSMPALATAYTTATALYQHAK